MVSVRMDPRSTCRENNIFRSKVSGSPVHIQTSLFFLPPSVEQDVSLVKMCRTDDFKSNEHVYSDYDLSPVGT